MSSSQIRAQSCVSEPRVLLRMLPLVLFLISLTNVKALAADVGTTLLENSQPSLLSGEALRSPFTVVTRTHFKDLDGDDQQGSILAGLLVESSALAGGKTPLALGLTWSHESLGWFGSVWSLQLRSELELLPEKLLPKPDSGFLAGSTFITLHNSEPQPGHTYEAALGYNPQSGAASIAVTDLTTGDHILEQALNLNPYSNALRPCTGLCVGAVQDPGGRSISIAQPLAMQVVDVMLPFGLEWKLMQKDEWGNLTSVTHIDRSKETLVQLRMPWEVLPGSLQFWLDNGHAATQIAQDENPMDKGLVVLPVQHLAAGDQYQLIMQYADRGQLWTLGKLPFSVGVVRAKLENVEIAPIDDAQLQVTGRLNIQADGSVANMDAQLNLALYRDNLTLNGNQKQGRIIAEPVVEQSILTKQLSNLDSPMAFDFSAIVPIPPDSVHYQVWRTVLTPTIDAPLLVEADQRETLFRLHKETTATLLGASNDIKVMTYNIRHGEGVDNKIDLNRIADAIALSGADIIGLNEVDSGTDRSSGVDQPAVLAKLLGMHAAFGWNITYQNGLYGNAVLSRYPIISTRNIPLPNPRYGMFEVVVDVNGTPVRFYTTHLSLVVDEHTAQLKAIRELLAEVTDPVILVGDFNSLADSARDPGYAFAPVLRDTWRLATGRALGTNKPLPLGSASGYTFNSSTPDRRIDFIFINKRLELTGTEPVYTIVSEASDHMPFMAHVRVAE